MRVRHRLQIQCACPSDDLPDLYDVTVECERTIKVEDIISAAGECEKKKIFQEELTVWLARKLNARVTTRGWHFGKVETEVSA